MKAGLAVSTFSEGNNKEISCHISPSSAEKFSFVSTKRQRNMGSIKEVRVARCLERRPHVSHLMYVDNVLLFCMAKMIKVNEANVLCKLPL